MAHPIQQALVIRVQDLPSELLTQIVHSIPSFSSLNNFVAAYSAVADIVIKDPKKIFKNVLEAEYTPLQIQKIISTIIAFRKSYSADYLPTEAFFFRYLEGEDRPVRTVKCKDPIGMLNYVATISESVRFYTESFAQKRILNPSENYAARVSESKMYRVIRTFWRFQLCYELAHPEDAAQLSSDNDSKVSQQWDRRYIFYENHTTVQRERQVWLTCNSHQPSYCLNEFLETLLGWEIDEIEVVRFTCDLKSTLSNIMAPQTAPPNFPSSPPFCKDSLGI